MAVKKKAMKKPVKKVVVKKPVKKVVTKKVVKKVEPQKRVSQSKEPEMGIVRKHRVLTAEGFRRRYLTKRR